MNILNIILLSCALAVTVAQKVGDTSNDIIDGQGRNTGGYGLLRPGLQGGYNQGGYNQGGYNQGGYNQGGYNQGGYNQGGYNQGGYNQGGYNQGYNGYNGGYGGAPGGYGGYGGYNGYGQGYGGNQGYGGGASGLYPGAGQGGYPGGFGGGYGGGFGGYPRGLGQGYPRYGGSGSASVYRPNPYKPGFDNGFPELEYPGRKQYRPYRGQSAITPYEYHTYNYPTTLEDRYRYSDNVSRLLGRKAGEIKEGEGKS